MLSKRQAMIGDLRRVDGLGRRAARRRDWEMRRDMTIDLDGFSCL